jgi:hypothetical protein
MTLARRALPLCLLALALLGACESEHRGVTEQAPLDALHVAPTSGVAPQEVGRTFALGGRHTDVQREALLVQLIGQVVEWEIRVYEVRHRDRAYRVLSQPLADGDAGSGFNVLRAHAIVTPMSDSDHAALRSVQTDDAITVRGQVQGIELRTLVLIEPAVLVTKTTQ